jgi:hypothetical protein
MLPSPSLMLTISAYCADWGGLGDGEGFMVSRRVDDDDFVFDADLVGTP